MGLMAQAGRTTRVFLTSRWMAGADRTRPQPLDGDVDYAQQEPRLVPDAGEDDGEPGVRASAGAAALLEELLERLDLEA